VKVIRFAVLGKPISVNQLYRRNRNGSVRKSEEAEAYATLVAARGMDARRRARSETTDEPVDVELRIFFANERPDTDGPVKLILDALQAPQVTRDVRSTRWTGAGIIRNDRQVRNCLVRREVDAARPRVEVAVGPVGEVFTLQEEKRS
jgi:Holliday junction resolvase RusA-like endonuclease